jgi:hypothetical protein
MTKRELQAEVLALRAERDVLKGALFDACGLLALLATTEPHTATGDCAHCLYLERAAAFGKPLGRYRAEVDAATADFARTNPARYAEIRRGILAGADAAAGSG